MNNTTAELQTIEPHAEATYEKARRIEDAGLQKNFALLAYIHNALTIPVDHFWAALEGVQSKVVTLMA